MSHYGFYDAKVDYMICNNCTTEAFAWIAEIFSCPTCDSDEYVYPEEAVEVLPNSERNYNSARAGRLGTGTEEMVKKRKRSTSNGGRRKYSR